MEKDYVKRFVTKDGNERVSIYREDYSENPRDATDEPLHCEDWSRDYSIMTKQERETRSQNATCWFRYMLERYGNTKEIVGVLKQNANNDKHFDGEMCLKYDKSRHEWILYYWVERWTDYSGETHGNKWEEETSYAAKLKNITAWDIVTDLDDEMVDVFADKKYFTDGIKIASYSFGYYGSISFDDSFSTRSEGIAWLDKDEFLKYSGNGEDYWKDKSLKDIEFLLEELEAWADNEVYGFVIEKAVRTITNVRYPDGEYDDTETESVEWEETDSCWGFYGELDKSVDWILDSAGFKKEELYEV